MLVDLASAAHEWAISHGHHTGTARSYGMWWMRAVICLGRNLAIAGALEAAYDLGWERGCVRASADATMEDLAASWISNTAGRPAPGTGGTTP